MRQLKHTGMVDELPRWPDGAHGPDEALSTIYVLRFSEDLPAEVVERVLAKRGARRRQLATPHAPMDAPRPTAPSSSTAPRSSSTAGARPSSATPRPAPPPTPAASAASSAPWWLERAQEARAKRYPQTPPNDRAQRVTASDLLARVEAALEEEAGAVVARLKRAGVASVPTASEVREQLLDLALGAWLAATDTNAARARHPLGYFPDDLLSALPGKERTILDGAAHAIERRWLREHAPAPASTS
jgi:hypothetical protein